MKNQNKHNSNQSNSHSHSQNNQNSQYNHSFRGKNAPNHQFQHNTPQPNFEGQNSMMRMDNQPGGFDNRRGGGNHPDRQPPGPDYHQQPFPAMGQHYYNPNTMPADQYGSSHQSNLKFNHPNPSFGNSHMQHASQFPDKGQHVIPQVGNREHNRDMRDTRDARDRDRDRDRERERDNITNINSNTNKTDKDKKEKEKEKDSSKNNYEYICLNIRHHLDLFNYIRDKKWEYRVISDIKKEIKSNNNIESEYKNFYISIPKDDIQKIKEDDGEKLKRKRRTTEEQSSNKNEDENENENENQNENEEKEEVKKEDADANINIKESDMLDNQIQETVPLDASATAIDNPTTDINLKSDVKADVKKDIEEQGNEDEESPEKKTKMVSMTEARRKAVGQERKFCQIIGFPIDLDMEELVAEMINLGCKQPGDIKWQTDEYQKDKLKDMIECEFTDDKDVDILLKSDVMVRRRNIMVLPKIKDKNVYEMIAFHQIRINYKFPDDFIVQNVRPLHLFNCFLQFGHIVSLNIGFNGDPTIITFVKKNSAESANSSRDFKAEPGTIKLQVNNGQTFLKIEQVKHFQKNGFPIPYKKFQKEDDGTCIQCEDKQLMETQVKKSIETKFEGVKVTPSESDRHLWNINCTVKGLSKDVIKFLKTQEWHNKIKINYRLNDDY